MTSAQPILTISRTEYKRGFVALFAATGLIALEILYLDSDTLSLSELASGKSLFLCMIAALSLTIAVWVLFRSPDAVVMNAHRRTIAVRYPLDFLAPARRTSRFSDWVAVHTCIHPGSEDSEPHAVLVLRAADGRFLELERSTAKRVPAQGFFDVFRTDCVEPEKIADLRRRVAAYTGLADWGFSQKAPRDPDWSRSTV